MYSNLCPECNLIHPPVKPGECPMSKQKKIEESAAAEQNVAIYNLSIILQKEFLKKSKQIKEPTKVHTFLNDCIKYVRSYII